MLGLNKVLLKETFCFKKFKIDQERCAMKIGTDGVLLGAWSHVSSNTQSILDIGAGTGLIALMLAQRSNAEVIDAIEIDEDAYEQCVGNFEASDWSDRLFCYHAGLDEFVNEIGETYDLIVSNPPFYSEVVTSGSDTRDMARQNISLPFHDLLEGVSKLLSVRGLFVTIIPYKEEGSFLNLAQQNGLNPKRIMRVRGNPNAPLKRTLIEFGFAKVNHVEEELTIELKRHEYTLEYQQLTKEFYLKM
jgi:tRNA1Val (adenine37-N6)-methyltransferase